MEVSLPVLLFVLALPVLLLFVGVKFVRSKFTVSKKYATPSPSGAVLVSGASSGIGFATTAHLASLGHRVFATVRSASKASALVQKLKDEGCDNVDNVTPVVLDVTDQPSIDAAVQTVEAALDGQGLVGLVNNAGLNVGPYPLEFVTPEDLTRQLDVNVVGQVRMVQAFLPLIRKATGRIVFMGSVAGKIAGNFQGPYAASKFALEAIADSLRRELSPWKISVSLINAAEIETPLLALYEKEGVKAKAKLQETNSKSVEYYGPFYDDFRVSRKKFVGNVGQTNRAIEHALVSPRPKTRYTVASKAMMAHLHPGFFMGLPSWSLLPDRFLDMRMSKSQWPRKLLKKN